jgi:autotransporter-associated beta strand protein
MKYAGGEATNTFTISKAAGSISYATATVNKTYGEAAFTNTLTKTGDGLLILDGANGTASGTIKVSEGSLAAANPYAAGGIAVTGGTGTLYSLSEPSDGSRVIAEQPLLFIPGASVSADATENVASVVARGWAFSTANYGLKDSWKVVLTQVEVDGGVLVSAGAKKPGMSVVIR